MRARREANWTRLGLGVPLALVGLAAEPPAPASACDSTTCLMLTRGAAGLMGRGSFRLGVTYWLVRDRDSRQAPR